MRYTNHLIYQTLLKFPCCDVHYDFHINTMFSSSLPPVFYLRYLWFFAHIGVRHALFWVFLRIVYVPYITSFSGLTIFDCPFKRQRKSVNILPQVLSTINSKNKNHIKIGWRVKILYTFPIWENWNLDSL
jgi:hypothetical protein